MLELAVLRSTGNADDVVDFGLLAETLLFYQRTHLVLESGTLNYLAKGLGPDVFLNVLDLPGVTASFLRDNLGTLTNNTGGLKLHNFSQFRVDPPGGKQASDHKWIGLQLERTLGTGRRTKRFTQALTKKLSSATYTDSALGSSDLPSVREPSRC
jgi:hypothetical protein